MNILTGPYQGWLNVFVTQTLQLIIRGLADQESQSHSNVTQHASQLDTYFLPVSIYLP